jgi:hypothetical protein
MSNNIRFRSHMARAIAELEADRILTRIRAEYLEMPGLRLTHRQAQRLCGVEGTLCQMVLDALVDTNFLCLKPNGLYVRVTDGADYSHLDPA